LVNFGLPLGQAYIHSPEDLILNKIHYYSLSHQSKHVRDIASMMVVSHELIDADYIAVWASSLGLTNTWQEMQEQIADILGTNR
jgi:hypothetical protein